MAIEARVSNTLHINMGPQHPSTHGVLRLELVLDGEVVVSLPPMIGYLHTGIEKTFEAKTYVQGVDADRSHGLPEPARQQPGLRLSHREAVELRDPERAQRCCACCWPS